MTAWPVAELTPAARAHAIAAAVPGAALEEAVVDAPYEEVWAYLADLEGSVPEFDTMVRRLVVRRRDGNRLRLHAWGPFTPLPLPFDAWMDVGYCVMRARFRLYMVVMAVTREPDGRARVTHVEGVPLPFTRWLRPLLRRVVRADLRGIARRFG